MILVFSQACILKNQISLLFLHSQGESEIKGVFEYINSRKTESGLFLSIVILLNRLKVMKKIKSLENVLFILVFVSIVFLGGESIFNLIFCPVKTDKELMMNMNNSLSFKKLTRNFDAENSYFLIAIFSHSIHSSARYRLFPQI